MSKQLSTIEILNSVDKQGKFKELTGELMLRILRGESTYGISREMKLEPYQVQQDIDMMLYTLKQHVGWKRYLKILFMK